MGGTSNCTGTLEVKHQVEWRPVDGGFHWNMMSSSVVCRQLDCGSAVSTESSHGFTHDPVWRITTYCVGTETLMSDCIIVETSHNTQKGFITGKPTVTCSGKTILAVLAIVCVFVRGCMHTHVCPAQVYMRL